MATVPGVKVEALQNGTPVRVKSGSWNWDLNKPTRSWELEFKEPITVDPDNDLWDVSIGFAGKLWPIAVGCKALAHDQDRNPNGHTTRISSDGGFDALSDILNYGCPYTYVFINQEWLTSVDPTARVVNGVVIGGGNPGTRLFHPRLPGKEIADANIQCILGPSTHRDAATWLADKVGFEFVSNCYDIRIADTFTVSSGTLWSEAITMNFAIWQPIIQVVPAKDENSRPIIYVLDIEGDDAAIETTQTLNITNAAIVNVSVNDDRSRNKIVDHLIIEGRDFRTNTLQMGDDFDLSTTQLVPVNFPVNKTIVGGTSFTLSVQEAAKALSQQPYQGSFGSGGTAFTPDPADHSVITLGFHKYRTAQGLKMLTINQVVTVYGVSGAMLSRITTTNKYSASKRLIQTHVDEEALVWFFDDTQKLLTSEFMWIKRKSTFQDTFVKAPNMAMTREFVNEKIKVSENQGVYLDPVRLGDVLRNNSSRDALSTQHDTLLTYLTEQRYTGISRSDPDALIKFDMAQNNLSGSSQYQCQYLENPVKDKSGKGKHDPLRFEYKKPGCGKMIAGQLCYHPAMTVKHDDIVDETIALMIKERIFNRQATGIAPQNRQVTVKTPVPLPIETMGIRVVLGASAWRVKNISVPVPGGTFFLKKASGRFSVENNGAFKHDLTLALSERY